jgi:iron complex outermembrane receptor protein
MTAAALMLGLGSTAVAQQAEPTLDTIVVTAQRIKDELEKEQALTPGGVSVVDGTQLYQRNVTNLADMLRYVPGVWSESSSGADELFFSSRGSNLDATDYDKNGIKLLQDGLPVTTADGNNHNRIVDPLSSRYAVIARGANALTYGASTLGGAIDFISPTAHDTPPLGLFINGGSHGSLNARGTAGLVTGDFDGLTTLEAKSWDGYRDHNEQQRWGAYANGGWQLSDAVTTRVYATYVDNDEDLPGALTRAEVAADDEQASPGAIVGNFQKNVETARIAAKTTWSIDDDSSFEFGLSYEDQSLYHPIVEPILVDFDGPGPDPAVEVFSLLVDTDHRDAGAMLRYQQQIGAHDLVAGLSYGDGTVEGGNYRNDAGRRNGLTERVDNSADSLEVFLVDRWRLGTAWTLVYGAQFVDASRDVRTIDVATGSVRNPKDDYSAVNPRVGVIYALNNASEVFASVSRLFEAPTTFELEDDVRANNATLDAMRGTVYEIGVRGDQAIGNGGRWHWDIAAYYAQIQDEILSIDDPLAPGNSLSTNIDDTIHAGIEALMSASFAISNGHRIEPLVSLTWNDFSFDSDPVYGGNDLPSAPEYVARGEVLYRTVNGFYAGPTFDLVGERFADFSNTYKVDGYELLGLRAGFSNKRWDLFGEIRNLTDEDYIATVSVLDTADADARVLYPGAPLSAYVGARLQF